MTNMKSTKKALITSALCLLLCVSMLVGATFAWFTDSVSSAKNTIVAGNLDVELEWSADGNTWAKVAGAANIFDPDALWEPGRVEVVYLKVSNLGTLALKYQLGVNVYNEIPGTNVAGKEFKLSDHLVFKTIEGLTEYANREAAQLAAGTEKGLKDYNGATTALEAGEVDYLTLIVYMPETVGNEANYRGEAVPTIELGINLYATQLVAESDSFGDDYDEDAWHADMTVYNEDDLKAALVDGGNIELGADIVLTNDWTPAGTSEEPFEGVIEGNGYTITGLTVSGVSDAALIAYAGENVTVRNLNLENVSIDSTKYAAGVVCNAGTGLTIENVTVSGTINATSYAAGLVFDADQVTIKNCENNATVTAGRASGVASWISNATVENVVNNGDITGTIGAAGIADRFSGAMKYATNNGTISGAGTEAAAGVVGIQLGAASTYEYCVNNGDVTTTADNPNSSAAGILGQTPSKAATLNYCINTGNITAEASYAAGIAYSLYGSVNANYCYNSGNVYGGDAAGGITPKAQYGSGDKANYCVVDASITSAGKVYAICNNATDSFYYAGDELCDKAGNVVTARAALTTLNAATGGVFFKIVEGRLEASLDYNWIGDALATPENVQSLINAAQAGDVIVLTAGEYHDTIVMKSGITLQGTNGAIVDCINLNGADNVTLKGITFDAAGAKMAYDGKGNQRFFANIISGDVSKNGKGTRGLVIDGCTFTGAFANGGMAIAFNDQGRGTGQSGNITIKNCTFETTGAYVDIYTYYSGYGELIIEGNTFASVVLDKPIYLGKYQSSTPVVVKGNTFENKASFDAAAYIQDHGSYGVSFDAADNTFNG